MSTAHASSTLGGRGGHAEGVARVEQEIRQAQAEALGRCGEQLDLVLAELAGLDRELDMLARQRPPVAADMVAETARRNRVRERAAALVYNLIVQREALGIVRHTAIHERYPLPSRRSLPDRRGSTE